MRRRILEDLVDGTDSFVVRSKRGRVLPPRWPTESQRKKGLITEAMTLARRLGSTKFWLSTGGHNETAQALYASLGGDRKPLGDVNYWWDLD